MAFSSRSTCQVAAWVCVLKPGSGARVDLILSYLTRSVPTNMGVTDRCGRLLRSTKQYKLSRAAYCLFVCMDHVATLQNTLESRPSAGTLHIRPCNVPSLPVAFGLVPGIGEILWTRRARYGIHEEVSSHQRREPCMGISWRGMAKQGKGL